jgi:hypothetical protein
MKNSEVKRVWNWFTIADVEREEKWLNEMAAAGWLLEKWNGNFRYTFRRGERGAWLYKIDMIDEEERGLDGETHINFLNECGIEVAYRHKKWLFLRKRAVDGPFDTANDLYSRLRITNKVYSYSIRVLCYLVVSCFVTIAISMLGYNLLEGNLRYFFEGISTGAGFGLVLGLTFFFIPAITKIRKEMDRLVREIGVKN